MGADGGRRRTRRDESREGEVGKGAHHVHVYPVGIRPGVLEVLLESLPQRIGNLMETDELADAQELSVVASSSRIEALNYRRYVAEDRCVHKCCEDNWERGGNGCEKRHHY